MEGDSIQNKCVVSTEVLREKIRQYSKCQRERQRTTKEDSLRFGLGEIKTLVEKLDDLTEKDVAGLAARIKRRKHATPEDMYRLSHAFLQRLENIIAFNKIPGALQVVIKGLTGRDAECKIRAAECLCNFSLGEVPVCDKIATLAGSYLVTYLHSNETELVRLCLWTIANILTTNGKNGHILMKMELLPQLWKLYADCHVTEPATDCREDAGLCLQLIALNAESLVTKQDYDFLLSHTNQKNPTCLAGEYHLQIIFHTLFIGVDVVANFSEDLSLYLIKYSLSNIYTSPHHLEAKSKQYHKILYAVRVLGNLLVARSNCFALILQQLSYVWNSNLVLLLNKLFAHNNSALTRETMWFLKNVLHREQGNNTLNTMNILDKLHISNEMND